MRKLSKLQKIFLAAMAGALGFVITGILGALIALIGIPYTTMAHLYFFGLRGYEAGEKIGFIIGGVPGAVIAIYCTLKYFRRREEKRIREDEKNKW